ncbi:LLM class flavin-dependent oxidoreductase [Streptomyces sp. L7]
MLGYIAAQTEKLILSTSTTLITTNDPVKIAEDFAMLQHLAGRPGRLDDGPRQHRPESTLVRAGTSGRASDLAVENHALLRRLVARGRRELGGREVPLAAPGLHGPRPALLDDVRRSSGTARSARPRSPEQAALLRRRLLHNNIFWPADHTKRMVELYRERYAHYGHGTPEQAIVGLGGQVFMRKNSQDAVEA